MVTADELLGPPVSGRLRTVPARLYPSPPRHVVPEAPRTSPIVTCQPRRRRKHVEERYQ